ncbi:hypothetical protein C7S18_21465 [Ahniella affigens]|uniref:Glycosyltransferase family 1 protein n=1 Tax=Ahniella affigens TaxID=2021234 RepID=A0A2P1PXK4_9GAMM|nr:hypothetical protein [Ahniella affigens]AVP99583.1 hypothetical protein C7S18_21465 [Ahniella affigens]
MALSALRQIYGRLLRFGRWLRSFVLARRIQHGALTIVPDRLIGPELALWQQQVIATILSLPAHAMPACRLALHEASCRTKGDSPVRRIRFQPEHTLVKPGGSDAAHAPSTNTPVADSGQSYLFRLLHQSALAKADLILDYSASNLAHWRASGQRPDLLARARWFAPLVLPIRHDEHPRRRARVTLFSDPNVGRRAVFRAEARTRGLPVQNAGGAYRQRQLMALLDDTHILINLRQSEHHDTLEELRVLPALARGVLVISEDVPLRDRIPYQDCVIWARRSEVLDVLAVVDADRERYWRDIFGSGRCAARLRALAADNRSVLAEFLQTL